MVINVKNYIDQDPEELYSEIAKCLEEAGKTILDFKAIEKTTYEFLEGTIGKLIEEYTFPVIEKEIIFRNVDTGIKEMLSKLIKDINKR